MHVQVQCDLSNCIARPWEEILFNKNRCGLGYDNGNNFHIPDYSKALKFVSGRFLDKQISEINKEKLEYQHCQRTGHKEDQCFDLHPCQHCSKKNHSTDKCSK
jgi:hypothetical protein